MTWLQSVVTYRPDNLTNSKWGKFWLWSESWPWRSRSITPKTIGILTKVFYTYGPNLLILAWTGDELSRGQTCWRTDGLTDGQTKATTIPIGQNWPRVKMKHLAGKGLVNLHKSDYLGYLWIWLNHLIHRLRIRFHILWYQPWTHTITTLIKSPSVFCVKKNRASFLFQMQTVWRWQLRHNFMLISEMLNWEMNSWLNKSLEIYPYRQDFWIEWSLN